MNTKTSCACLIISKYYLRSQHEENRQFLTLGQNKQCEAFQWWPCPSRLLLGARQEPEA